MHIFPGIRAAHDIEEMMGYYSGIFGSVNIIARNAASIHFEMGGTQMMLIHSDDKYTANPSVSYFVYGNNDRAYIEKIYETLAFDGKILFSLDQYEWSPLYAWVEDKYGVNWQLDVERINNTQRIVPCFLFANKLMGRVEEAIQYYVDHFDQSTILMTSPAPAHFELYPGALLFAQIKMNNYIINFMSSPIDQPHEIDYGNPLILQADDEIINSYKELLGSEGSLNAEGWLKDKYGIAWHFIARP